MGTKHLPQMPGKLLPGEDWQNPSGFDGSKVLSLGQLERA